MGITKDDIPTHYAWSNQMGVIWFPVLFEFWPHGKVSEMFGVLRSDGVVEVALFIIDMKGILRYANASDINKRSNLKDLSQNWRNLTKIE